RIELRGLSEGNCLIPRAVDPRNAGCGDAHITASVSRLQYRRILTENMPDHAAKRWHSQLVSPILVAYIVVVRGPASGERRPTGARNPNRRSGGPYPGRSGTGIWPVK
ncbi:MAG TPA: hypothetical protein P5316_21540, partial [Phycisphaerae bacterium]|nr:hypothetical protein [Phycisphaerae bacterium]